MPGYADLELGLHRRDTGSYAIEMRFNRPESDADVRLASVNSALVRFDIERLRMLEHDVQAYGKLLGEFLFADKAVWNDFTQAYRNAQSFDGPLRFRLFIGPSASELHTLRWETLRDPHDNSSLLVGEQIFFSRYLSSLDWRTVPLRPRGELRALVVIANPTNLVDYTLNGQPLAPVDVAGELERIQAGLQTIPSTVLGQHDRGIGRATLDNIVTHVRNGYDILYITNGAS